MKKGHEGWENIDVGASKAAKVLLSGLDRRLTIPAAALVRYSGWVLITLVIYLAYFESIAPQERKILILWIISYAVYILLLEIARRFASETYEAQWFRAIRVAINLVMISVLVGITPTERHLLIFAYIFPLLAAVVYFGENIWAITGVYLLTVAGISISEVVFVDNVALQFEHFLLFCMILAGLTIFFELVRNRIKKVIPGGRLTDLARELHNTLDLQQLMTKIVQHAISLTLAQRGLIIIINPRTKKYVGHVLHNFEFKADMSIENLAKNCSVLVGGQAFDNPDIASTFNNKSIYHKYFSSQPRAVLAEPLYNREHQIIGVLNVAHNNSNGFDKYSKSLLEEFAFLVGNAIENCFEHREVKLREAKNREAGEKFTSASTENEVLHILIEEARQTIQYAEKITFHLYQQNDHSLLPLHSYSIDDTPSLYLLNLKDSIDIKPDLQLGYGIAGHALEIKETVLVPDVDEHPWYVKLDHAIDIRSLLVAPLFAPQGTDLYGTISLESPRPSEFSLEDEMVITYLSTQASRAIARIRSFQIWRENGSTLRKILDMIRSFDISGSESALCEGIASAATDFLGFNIARIRILSKENMLITRAVTGVLPEEKVQLLSKDLPYARLKPFLAPGSKAESSFLIKSKTPGWGEFVDEYFHKPHIDAQRKSQWDPYDALITPLQDSSGNLMGILTLDDPVSGIEPNQYTMELIGVFANAASWLIESSRSQKNLKEQKYRTQSFIDTISRDLAKGRDIPTISEVVVQAGAKLLSAEGCSLYLVRGNEIELANSNYLAGTDYILRRKPISSLPGAGLTAWVAATGSPISYNNAEHEKHPAWAKEKEHLQNLPSKDCKSIMMAPVKDKDGKVIAVITLENKKTLSGLKDFDKEDEIRLQGLADEFGKALELIGLYDDIRELERSGLAEDIHDLINWYHSGVVLWIEALDVWYKHDDRKKISELMPKLLKHARSMVNELKTVHTFVMKNSFEESTLKQALAEIMSIWKTRATPKYQGDMQVQLTCPEDLDIPVKLRTTLIRIASLAFSNAIQHSGILEDPRIKIVVEVERKQNEVVLSVKDTGKGMNLKNVRNGFGLDRIRQLTEKINKSGKAEANFRINSKIGKGTRVCLHLKQKG